MQISYSPVSFLGNLLTTDLDGTWLIGAKDNASRSVEDRKYNTKAFKKVKDRVEEDNIDDVFINTGRNYSELSEVKNILKNAKMPINYIALEHGKRLLVKPEDLTSKAWLTQLFGKKYNYMRYADKEWEAKNSKPINTIKKFLVEEEGFVHRKDDGEKSIYIKYVGDDADKEESKRKKVKLEIIPPGITTRLSMQNDPDSTYDIEGYNKKLNNRIYILLASNDYQVSSAKTAKITSYTNEFARRDISKKAVAEYLRTKLGKDTREIRAGNDINDLEMLSDTSVGCIVVGKDPQLRERLDEVRDDVEYVSDGKLHKAIKGSYKSRFFANA